jgi:outer membrane PBP1 activator LpoA protein
MKIFNSFLTSIAAAAVLAGCGDKSGSSPQGANSVNTATNGFEGYVNSLGQAQKSADKTIDVSYLNQAVQQFNVQEGRYPKTLEELTPSYVAKIPEVPVGYKLDYDATKGEVKVVPQ